MTSTPDFPASTLGPDELRAGNDHWLGRRPYSDFSAAAQDVVDGLAAAWPDIDLWLVTATPAGHPEQPPAVMAWTGTWSERGAEQTAWSPELVSELLSVGPRSSGRPARASAPQSNDGTQPASHPSSPPPGGYVASPLLDPAAGTTEGAVWGIALSGYDPAGLQRSRPAVAAGSRLLSALRAALPVLPQVGQSTPVRVGLIERDPATGLRNSHGLATAMQAEQERCRLFGNKAALIVIDVLPSPPQALARPATAPPRRARAGPAPSTCSRDADDLDLLATWSRVADILTEACRGCDIGARLDVARFVVLAVESDLRAGTALGHRLRRGLRTAGLHASIGVAARRVGETMEDTLQRAALNPALHTHPRRRVHPLSVAALPAMVSGSCDPDLPR